ncbi:unnamed protein product [Ilex paraguariensis]|uniref:Uncharacterized protein n=1 Tax=Ilex paraguariensis TaxID=185542 RepID=A0ABC8T343_9AQUA
MRCSLCEGDEEHRKEDEWDSQRAIITGASRNACGLAEAEAEAEAQRHPAIKACEIGTSLLQAKGVRPRAPENGRWGGKEFLQALGVEWCGSAELRALWITWIPPINGWLKLNWMGHLRVVEEDRGERLRLWRATEMIRKAC